MITLHSLRGETIELPYHPDMPLWQYLRDVIAPTANFEIVDGKTVCERVIAGGKLFGFNNKHRLLSEMVEDGGKLFFQLPLGPSFGTTHGNACPDGGDASGCPICQEETFDFSLDCLHRFHAECLMPILARDRLCPVCRAPFTSRDREQLGYIQYYELRSESK
jgi:hypothetical protein